MQQSSVLRRAHEALSTYLPNDRPVNVLEAGGGSFTHISVTRPQRIVVLDISPEQLDRNTYADEKILGDLEDPKILKDRYDLIVCFDVLEHLEHPDRAFTNMANALAEGGLLVIGCPNLFSIKGLLTRLTPHAFHVWYYKKIRGIPDAGQPGHAPFPTYLRRAMAFNVLKQYAKSLGLEIIFAKSYVGPAVDELQSKHPLLHKAYSLPSTLIRTLTLGRIDLRDTDFVIVLRRPVHAAELPSVTNVAMSAAPAAAHS